MAHEKSERHPPARRPEAEGDETFKRSGPEPPENDSGPSPSVEETARAAELDKEGVAPAQKRP
jgi:hypothetical protein